MFPVPVAVGDLISIIECHGEIGERGKESNRLLSSATGIWQPLLTAVGRPSLFRAAPRSVPLISDSCFALSERKKKVLFALVPLLQDLCE